MKKFDIVSRLVMRVDNFLHYYGHVYRLELINNRVYADCNDVGIDIRKAANYNHIVGMLAANGYLLVPDELCQYVEHQLFRSVFRDGEFEYCNSNSNKSFEPFENYMMFDWLSQHEYPHRQSVVRTISLFEEIEFARLGVIDLYTLSIDSTPRQSYKGRKRKLNFLSYIQTMFKDELFKLSFKHKQLTLNWIRLQYRKYYTDSFHIGHLSLPNYNLSPNCTNWYESPNKKRYSRQRNKNVLKFELENLDYGNH